ncbi:hypothetical protein AGMMS50268_06050 [Spirochaetia bacterium]|nr:hypothetical protein AGMMS50268_06050 [Spirochaetia bacterium]
MGVRRNLQQNPPRNLSAENPEPPLNTGIETLIEQQSGEGSPLEELSGDNGISILYRPFLFAANKNPEILKALDDEPATVSGPAAVKPPVHKTAPEDIAVILERNGIHFINSSILKPGRDMEKNLDSEFKKLVDSVLARHSETV